MCTSKVIKVAQGLYNHPVHANSIMCFSDDSQFLPQGLFTEAMSFTWNPGLFLALLPTLQLINFVLKMSHAKETIAPTHLASAEVQDTSWALRTLTSHVIPLPGFPQEEGCSLQRLYTSCFFCCRGSPSSKEQASPPQVAQRHQGLKIHCHTRFLFVLVVGDIGLHVYMALGALQ